MDKKKPTMIQLYAMYKKLNIRFKDMKKLKMKEKPMKRANEKKNGVNVLTWFKIDVKIEACYSRQRTL